MPTKIPLTIAPGVYRLTRDVENPTPDRRKSGWHVAPTVKAGTVFHVVSQSGDTYASLHELGGYAHYSTPTHSRLGQALIPALVAEPESLGVLLYTRGEDGEGVNKRPLRAILARLVEREIVTLDQVREILAEHDGLYASGDEEWMGRLLSDHGF